MNIAKTMSKRQQEGKPGEEESLVANQIIPAPRNLSRET